MKQEENRWIKQEPKYVLDNSIVGDSWRMFRIMGEFVEGFDTLSAVPLPAVTIYGSARTPVDHPWYTLTERVAYELALAGYAVITGGGPGLMEAANKGAADAGGVSIGLNISLPHEQRTNQYTNFPLHFKYFFVRKVMFMKYSTAFVCMPGGFGSMDELFECMTLIQTQRIKPFPIILVGSKFWTGLVDWIRDTMLDNGTINQEDLHLFRIIDDPDDVVQYIKEHAVTG